MSIIRAEVLPFEDEIPVKASPKLGRSSHVPEVVHVDHIYDWTHYMSPVLKHGFMIIAYYICY
jgi:hypothetical protein